MAQSTLYWIIAAIIVVLLILIILSVVASRRRREAETEVAETLLERRGITADAPGEQAAAPAAPTRLSRLDEAVAEKDARPAAGGAGVTVDQQEARSAEATAETHRRDPAAPAARGTLRPRRGGDEHAARGRHRGPGRGRGGRRLRHHLGRADARGRRPGDPGLPVPGG
ncbi:hypothetical protein [Micrococcus luteus]|uniref:hypothetical protein n=1 Tax=Micrococcus luteus TaxID=1270 RepID=UPI0024B0DB2E|nr:hypothetical protein [Micrococcus luteus]